MRNPLGTGNAERALPGHTPLEAAEREPSWCELT